MPVVPVGWSARSLVPPITLSFPRWADRLFYFAAFDMAIFIAVSSRISTGAKAEFCSQRQCGLYGAINNIVTLV